MKKHYVMRRLIKHLCAVFFWGIVATLLAWLCLMLFWHVSDGLRFVVFFPAMWIRPQTLFDNMFCSMLSVGLFWGVAIHFARVGFASIMRSCNKPKAKKILGIVKLLAVGAVLVLLCSIIGGFASSFSARIIVETDYSQESTVGVIRRCGFPIWFYEAAPGHSIMSGWRFRRLDANKHVWTTVFMLVCCGLYYMKTKRKFVLPVGMLLGMGGAGMAAFLLLTDFDSQLPPYTGIWIVEKAVNNYASDNDGEFPVSLKELIKPTNDGEPPLLKRLNLRDSWGKRIKYERKENRFTLRSSGPDRIMGTEDDVTNYALDYELRCAQDSIWTITQVLNIYTQKHNGEFPDSLDELVNLTDDGDPLSVKRENLTDPWGEPIGYERKEGGFIIFSSGPDKAVGTVDDITNEPQK